MLYMQCPSVRCILQNVLADRYWMSTMAKKVVQITIIPTLADSETLMIRDAMQHVLDFFELLHDENNECIAWELTGANFSSPFVVESRPVNTQTGVEAYVMVKPALQGIADIMGIFRLSNTN